MIDSIAWQPSANIDVIKKRAALYQQIRSFMQERAILEVDTPILSHYCISDPYVESLQTTYVEPYYLNTSPEFCMKRLLAAEVESIYQIAHVFRGEEAGKRHNIEFTMLEWYRLGFDYYQLMDELADLLNIIGLATPDKMTYAEAFQQTIQIDPHTIKLTGLCQLANKYGWKTNSNDRHELLDFIFSSVVMRKLNREKPLIIHDYPECMSALATLKSGTPIVSERFELFIDGMEIANGFNELTNAKEQKARFEADLEKRKQNSQHEPTIDPNFLAALAAGLPKCAGIAVGLDRLLMILTENDDINNVTTFNLQDS